jgi:hypothetical protein
VPRPRAADDFPAIRTRMEELRRDRAEISPRGEPIPPRRAAPLSLPTPADKLRLLSAILRALARTNTD